MYTNFKKSITVILCFLVICAPVKAESVFSLDFKTDITLSALAVGAFVSSLLIKTPPSQSQIPPSLSKRDVNAFDRLLMVTRQNAAIKRASDITMVGLGFLPLVSLIDNFTVSAVTTYLVMYSQAMLLAYGTRMLFKNNVTRFRPYSHDGRELRTGHRHDSFPSGHTCAAFLSATFFSTTFVLENPGSRWKWPAIIGSHTLAASVGAMRMMGGMHFLTDVLAGAAMGSFFGWLIPVLHAPRRRNNEQAFPVKLTGNGLLVSLSL